MLQRLLKSKVLWSTVALGGAGYTYTNWRELTGQPDTWEEHVVTHGPLRKLADRLYMVQADLRDNPNLRAMAVYQLRDKEGGLMIHSATALNDSGMAELEALGKPRLLVVPNTMHRMDASVYKQRYPNLVVLSPEACRGSVEKKVNVDDTCEAYFAAHADAGVKVHKPSWWDWVNFGELVYELELNPKQRAFVATDLFMNLSQAYIKNPVQRVYFNWIETNPHPDHPDRPRPAMGSNLRMLFTSRADAKKFMTGLADRVAELRSQKQDVVMFSVAHGDPLTGSKEIENALRKVADSC